MIQWKPSSGCQPGCRVCAAKAALELPHAHGSSHCNDCGHRWIAVWPLGAQALECPACHGTNTDTEQDE